MLSLRGTGLVAWVAALVVALGAVAVLAGCGGTAGTPFAPGGEVTQGAAPDSPAVVLHGYTFGSTSNRLTHRFFKATPTTPKWVYSGIGRCQGFVRTCLFSDGGLVKGVKTLRMSNRDINDQDLPPGWWEDFWLAQDTQGNIHFLKHQVTRDKFGHKDPAQLCGVAAGGPPTFWLPRAGQLTLNHTWTWSFSGKALYQCKVISLTGHVGGKSGLLVVRGINDKNEDGKFDPSWTGPDGRDDYWYQPGVGVWYWQWHSNGGLLRNH